MTNNDQAIIAKIKEKFDTEIFKWEKGDPLVQFILDAIHQAREEEIRRAIKLTTEEKECIKVHGRLLDRMFELSDLKQNKKEEGEECDCGHDKDRHFFTKHEEHCKEIGCKCERFDQKSNK